MKVEHLEKKVAFLSFEKLTYCFLDTQDLLNSLAELVDVRLLVKLAGRKIFSEKFFLELTPQIVHGETSDEVADDDGDQEHHDDHDDLH